MGEDDDEFNVDEGGREEDRVGLVGGIRRALIVSIASKMPVICVEILSESVERDWREFS